MGQYWKVVNLDKHEFVDQYKVGAGAKLWEQLAAHPGTGAALIVLTAAMPETRGGGDFDLDSNWHGPERTFPKHNTSPGPMPVDYQEIAHRTIGRWAGDRIAIVGDYAENGDLAREHKARTIYSRCYSASEIEGYIADNVQRIAGYKSGERKAGSDEAKAEEIKRLRKSIREYKAMLKSGLFTDISDDVARVIEHELQGKFEGDGWKHWREDGCICDPYEDHKKNCPVHGTKAA